MPILELELKIGLSVGDIDIECFRSRLYFDDLALYFQNIMLLFNVRYHKINFVHVYQTGL